MRVFGVCAILGAIACSPIVNVADDSSLASAGMSAASQAGGTSGVPMGPGGATSGIPLGAGGGTPAVGGSPTLFLSPADVAAIQASSCNAWAAEAEFSPVKLELVIDVSSSMNGSAPGTDRTKWEVTRDALLEAVVGVTGPGLSAGTAVGLLFFPNKTSDPNVSTTPLDSSVCLNTQGAVPMYVLGDNGAGTQRSLLRQRLNEAVLGRGTPTVDAYNWAVQNSLLSATQLAIPGDPYVLLMTDGMPTLNQGCWNPSGTLSNLSGEPVEQAVTAASAEGVKTFIVGSPGSEDARNWLSKAAYLGGTGAAGCDPNSATGPYCHLDMTAAPDFSVALRDGLAQVVASLATCKFDIPVESTNGTSSVDPREVSPIIKFSNGTIILVGASSAAGGDCLDGYRLIGDAQLELCKNTCDAFLGDPQASIQIIFGCTTEDITTGII